MTHSKCINKYMTTVYHKHHTIKFVKGKRIRTETLTKLTVKQHAKEHKRLYEQGGHLEDYVAYKALSGQIGKEEILLLRAKIGASQPGKLNPMYGRNHTKKSRDQMSKKRKGVKLSASHVANIVIARKRLVNHKHGIHKTVICPTCNWKMNPANLKRHINVGKCKSL